MKKIILYSVLILSLVVILSFSFLLFRDRLWPSLTDLRNFNFSDLDQILEKVEKQIISPPPLEGSREANNTLLTVAGVIEQTNYWRDQNSLPKLKNNSQLSAAAEAKLNDMFKRQYFEHISPSGQGPADWVEAVGYSYITVGENLALGNYQNDQKLVQAWLDSPGHRENILNRDFTEIGVAVGLGEFEGLKVWLAVQVFAKPTSACPAIDQQLKTEIASAEIQLNLWTEELAKLEAKLKTEKPKGRAGQEEIDQYNSLVNEYNNLANQYNLLVQETKQKVDRYNQQVIAFNACAGN